MSEPQFRTGLEPARPKSIDRARKAAVEASRVVRWNEYLYWLSQDKITAPSLAEATGRSERTVQRHLRELQKMKLVEMVRTEYQGTYSYRLTSDDLVGELPMITGVSLGRQSPCFTDLLKEEEVKTPQGPEADQRYKSQGIGGLGHSLLSPSEGDRRTQEATFPVAEGHGVALGPHPSEPPRDEFEEIPMGVLDGLLRSIAVRDMELANDAQAILDEPEERTRRWRASNWLEGQAEWLVPWLRCTLYEEESCPSDVFEVPFKVSMWDMPCAFHGSRGRYRLQGAYV